MMAWVKLDDQFFRHPKVIEAGRDARDLYLAALCFCAAGLTNGLIPAKAVRVLAADAEISDPDGAAGQLVMVGLWEREAEGYRVHDYHDYNPTKDRVLATREARAEAGSRGGKQRASNLLGASLSRATDNVANEMQANVNPVPVPQEYAANAAAEPPPPPGPESTNGRSPPAAAVNEPYRLFQVLCEETGADESAATKGEKQKQLGVAKRLLADGVTEDELRRHLRFLRSQSWRTGFIDLTTVASELGKWRMNGRPEREPTPLRRPKPRVATI